jgi:hypothetical protein
MTALLLLTARVTLIGPGVPGRPNGVRTTTGASFEHRATVVTVQEGSAGNVDLKVILESAIDAEIAKLP